MRKFHPSVLVILSVLALPLLAGSAWAAEAPAAAPAAAQVTLADLGMPAPVDLTVYYNCYQEAQCWVCEITDTWAQRVCIQRSCFPGGDSEDCWYY